MKEFVEFVVRRLVDNPDAVTVEMEENAGKVVFRVTTSERDIGKVIGKSGRTAAAVRTLLRAFAAREGKKAVLSISEMEHPSR